MSEPELCRSKDPLLRQFIEGRAEGPIHLGGELSREDSLKSENTTDKRLYSGRSSAGQNYSNYKASDKPVEHSLDEGRERL